jgi:hypothetical protein
MVFNPYQKNLNAVGLKIGNNLRLIPQPLPLTECCTPLQIYGRGDQLVAAYRGESVCK